MATTDLTTILIDTLPMPKLLQLGEEFGIQGRSKNDFITALRAIEAKQSEAKR